MSTLEKILQRAAGGAALKKAVYPVADRLLEGYGAWRMRDYDIRNTVALVSTGRGGSTWLAEQVMSLPNRVLVWEPLHLGNNPGVRELGVGWNTYLLPETEALALESYLERLFTGRAFSTRTLTSLNFDARSFLRPEGIVVKFVQAHLLLPWLTRRFPVPVVGLIRHPCAVVASQLRHNDAWASVDKSRLDVDPRLLADQPDVARAFETIETRVDALAFAWGIKTRALVRSPGRLLVAYEALLEDPASEAQRIFTYIGQTPPPDIAARIRRPSATTNSVVSYEGWEDRLTAWRRSLTVEDQERILAMAHRLGVTCYGVDPRPDLSLVASPDPS